MEQPERIAYLLSLKDQGIPVIAIERQYGVSNSTFYYWLSRYETYHTYENLSRVPHQIHSKVTEEIKAAVLKKHRKNPRLGCWRLSLFEYEGQKLGPTTIWLILMEARQPRLPPRFLYHLTHTCLDFGTFLRRSRIGKRPPDRWLSKYRIFVIV